MARFPGRNVAHPPRPRELRAGPGDGTGALPAEDLVAAGRTLGHSLASRVILPTLSIHLVGNDLDEAQVHVSGGTGRMRPSRPRRQDLAVEIVVAPRVQPSRWREGCGCGLSHGLGRGIDHRRIAEQGRLNGLCVHAIWTHCVHSPLSTVGGRDTAPRTGETLACTAETCARWARMTSRSATSVGVT
jgi:hypothetical protein